MKIVYFRLYDYGNNTLFTIAGNKTKRSVSGLVELKPKTAEYVHSSGVKAWGFQTNNGFSEKTDTYDDVINIV